MRKIAFLVLVVTGIVVQAQNPLLIPDTISGTNINLTLQNGTHQFYAGTNTTTMGANGNILGPTLLLNQGDFVNFSVTNQIADTTTIHWHGLHVSADNDGGPHTVIAPNATWTPSFSILDKAATYWYHPHLHHKTNKHVSKGIAGFIIVRDAEEAALLLPRTYGVDDFPLVMQTKDFDANKEIVVPSNADDVVMVNATIDPVLSVPAQVVRLRLLNGSSMRVFNVGLNNNQTFYQIGSDGGLLSAPYAITRIRLAPGERAEILVDFSTMLGQTVFLKSYASEFSNGIYGATNPGMNGNMTLTNYNPNSLNGTDFNLLTFTVDPATTNPITTIPNSLVSITPIPEQNAGITRELEMAPAAMGMNQLNGNFTINGVAFDKNVINYTIPLHNTEIWSIRNRSAIAHPFHIHDVQFFVLDRNGNTPLPGEQGYKDVILIKPQETIRFIAQFTDFASSIPYMYHCHMLYHEDKGMMGQFIVDSTLDINEPALDNNIKIYPNPSSGVITIELMVAVDVQKIEVYNVLGKLENIYNNVNFDDKITIEILSRGVHFVKVYGKENVTAKKIIIE